jgi:replicative DNA helicase
MDIEWATLCKAVETRDFRALLDARITTSFFQDPENADVFGWMLRFWNDHTTGPTEGALHHEYPTFALIETPEPMGWYLEELRDQYKYSRVTEVLDGVKEPLKRGDADNVVKLLAHGIESVNTDVSDLTDEDFTKTTGERMARYDSLAAHRGMQGIPTGFPTMDLATSGLQKEQLITVMGTQKVGKSVILIKMASTAHAAGYRPLFVTFEMSTDEQGMRHDAFRAGISYTRLANGTLTREDRFKLRKMFHGMEAMQPMTFVHDPASTTTVSALSAKISLHNPDCVYVDGAYLMDPEIEAEPNSAQALTSITRSLKRLAQRAQVPIVASTQALTWKARRGKLTLDSIGYSSSFAQDSDVIFGLEEVKDNEEERLLRIVAARNTARKDVRLRFDWEHGSIDELDEVHYHADDEDDDSGI